MSAQKEMTTEERHQFEDIPIYSQADLLDSLSLQRAELAEAVRDERLYFDSYASRTLTHTTNSEYQTGSEIFRKLLSIIEGGKG